MRRLLAAAFVLLFAFGAALAEGEKKPFIKLVRGNFWKYDCVKEDDKTSGKIELVDIDKDGKYKVELSQMQGPGDMKWSIAGGFLVWVMERGKFSWKVLKLDAGKGDTWQSEFSEPGSQEGARMVITSKVLATEDVQTPAGSFKGCLKVENVPVGEPTVVRMWWASGVGLVKLEVMERGKIKESWMLRSYRVGPQISDEVLKEMLEKADVVALVSVPGESKDSQKARVKVASIFKGKPVVQEGRIVISQPSHAGSVAPFEPGDFVVFLKNEGNAFVLLYSALKSDKRVLDRLGELIAPPEAGPEELRKLCIRAKIIVAAEVVVLADRGGFKYYVVKIDKMAKGPAGREFVDILQLENMELEKGKKYVFLLEDTVVSGRKLARPVGGDGFFEYNEGLFNKLVEICKSSK